MVSYEFVDADGERKTTVLILVVVEDGLVHGEAYDTPVVSEVS